MRLRVLGDWVEYWKWELCITSRGRWRSGQRLGFVLLIARLVVRI